MSDLDTQIWMLRTIMTDVDWILKDSGSRPRMEDNIEAFSQRLGDILTELWTRQTRETCSPPKAENLTEKLERDRDLLKRDLREARDSELNRISDLRALRARCRELADHWRAETLCESTREAQTLDACANDLEKACLNQP